MQSEGYAGVVLKKNHLRMVNGIVIEAGLRHAKQSRGNPVRLRR